MALLSPFARDASRRLITSHVPATARTTAIAAELGIPHPLRAKRSLLCAPRGKFGGQRSWLATLPRTPALRGIQGYMWPALQAPIANRSIFMWVENIFNAVDHSRIRAVGAERACAEFVFRMEGRVRVVGAKDFITSTPQLPSGNIAIEAIEFDDATVTPRGMEYFRGLESIRFLRLSNCRYVMDEGLLPVSGLTTLEELDLTATRITDKALEYILPLRNLKQLKIPQCDKIANKEAFVGAIVKAIPGCEVFA